MLHFPNPNTHTPTKSQELSGWDLWAHTLWLTLVKGVLSVMVSKGDRAPFPSVGAATSQLNWMEDWLMPASLQRSFMRAYLGK